RCVGPFNETHRQHNQENPDDRRLRHVRPLFLCVSSGRSAMQISQSLCLHGSLLQSTDSRAARTSTLAPISVEHQNLADRATIFVSGRNSSVPCTTTVSWDVKSPKTSWRSPITSPRWIETHSTVPSPLTRITNIRSVVVTTALRGTNAVACGRRTGHSTSANI